MNRCTKCDAFVDVREAMRVQSSDERKKFPHLLGYRVAASFCKACCTEGLAVEWGSR